MMRKIPVRLLQLTITVWMYAFLSVRTWNHVTYKDRFIAKMKLQKTLKLFLKAVLKTTSVYTLCDRKHLHLY